MILDAVCSILYASPFGRTLYEDVEMSKVMRISGLILIMILLLPAVSSSALEKQIVIGLVPEINVFRQMDRYRPLAHYLTQKTGIAVKFTMFRRYRSIFDQFADEDIDGAFLGSLAGAQAHEKFQAEALVRPIDFEGKTTYHAHIFVRKDSGIHSVADMKGKVMAFVDPTSVSGYIYPLAYFKENGVKDIGSYFSEYYFAGSHDAVIDAVLERFADVGVVKTSLFDKLNQSDPRIARDLLMLDESPEFPTYGLFVKESLDEGLKQKLKNILLEMQKTIKGRAVLKKMWARGFVDADSHGDYTTTLAIVKKAGIDIHSYDYTRE